MVNKETRTCNQTRNIRSEIIVDRHLNDKDTYYGGDIMAHFDSAGGGAIFNFIRKASFTATVDEMTFVSPVYKSEQIYVEAFVSGAGTSSVEVFTKLIASNLKTFEKRLAAYAFLTYVVQDRNNPEFTIPILVPESEEEITICEGYAKRREINLEKRKQGKKIKDVIQLTPIWEQR
ncbi:acyl-CoA thioesterase [Jeotgalibaca porci]|uniref:acyl-CoA thioesterase n=1 Tax=Jeotgalibaca porci TaxID=1868793 RepID=UPI0035A02144